MSQSEIDYNQILNNRVSQRVALQIGTLMIEKITAEEEASIARMQLNELQSKIQDTKNDDHKGEDQINISDEPPFKRADIMSGIPEEHRPKPNGIDVV